MNQNTFNILAVVFIGLLVTACKQNSADRFVEIDGHKQHILDMGTGSPVVIFITGAGFCINNRIVKLRGKADR